MTSHVVVILVTRAVSCVVLFSSCCVGVVAVYLYGVLVFCLLCVELLRLLLACYTYLLVCWL